MVKLFYQYLRTILLLFGILGDFSNDVNIIEFSPDCSTLVTVALNNTVRIIDVTTGGLLHLIKNHADMVNSVKYSSDGKIIVTASSDKTACIFDVYSGKLKHILNHNENVYSAEFSPDGKNIVTRASDNTARIWDVISGKLLYNLDGPDLVESVNYTCDGKVIVTTYLLDERKIWDAKTGKLLKNQNELTSNFFSSKCASLGKTDISTTADGKTIFFDSITGKMLYTRIQLENNNWLVYDEHYRFDGTPGALEKLYFVCGTEIIELWQVKQSLRVRNLYEKIINKEDLSGYIKLSNLDLCGKLPLIEQVGDRRSLKFSIEKRSTEIFRIEVLLDKMVVKTIDPGTLKWDNNKAFLYLDSNEIFNILLPESDYKIKVQAVSVVDGKKISNR